MKRELYYTSIFTGTATEAEKDAYLATAGAAFEGKVTGDTTGQSMTAAQRDRYFGQLESLGAAMRASDARRAVR